MKKEKQNKIGCLAGIDMSMRLNKLSDKQMEYLRIIAAMKKSKDDPQDGHWETITFCTLDVGNKPREIWVKSED